ncbi:oxidoreductase [Thalassotalea loyana]|uniref:Oxidoreductase n=1 Tax=Thalassotalea loyana TaxID=280483 RepID=A0ABQ6HC61_9GAMM|nr:NAD-dependent epimerase/dehydratase family protein [Thalassotalea loyana]GLX85691.1 oxidoreductase [Thalassotalea loyana]
MKVLIFGATGLTGIELVRQIRDHALVTEIHIAARTKPKNIEPSDKLKLHLINFNSKEAIHDLITSAHFDYIYCALGTTIKKTGSKEAFKAIDVDLISLIGSEALYHSSANAFCFISAIGADISSKFFYNHCKGLTEQNLIQTMQHSSTQNRLIICRPSLLTGNRDEFRLGENISAIMSRVLPFVFKGPFKQYRPIACDTVAAAIIKETLDAPLAEKPLISVLENTDLHALGSL